MYSIIENTGDLSITDLSTEKNGTLTGYKASPIYNSGNLQLVGGKISGNSYGIYNKENGTANIEGGNIQQNTYGIYAVGGIVNVKEGANIERNTYGTFTNGGITNIEGGTITANEYGVYTSNGSTNITGGNVKENIHEIQNGGTGTTSIISGNIVTNNETAIKNISPQGTIVIGTPDGNVTKETPVIQAEEYAINDSGKGSIKFYDGIIKGKKGGLLGLYLYLETGYTTKTESVDGYYCDTLALSGTVSTVAKIGEVEYTNLQSAINAYATEETTITLVNSINTNETFIIEEGRNITIDLNGKNIISATVENIIENAGDLKIIDTNSNQTGKISNIYKAAIQNTGTLKFYDGLIKADIAVEGIINVRPNGYIINKNTTDGVEELTLVK